MTPAEEWSLEGRHVGRRVLVYERVDSTNTLALALAQDTAEDGLVLVAREQTAGRGQYGRTWLSPAGSSVLLSALVFPPPPLQRPAILTAWAAVSVCEAIREAAGLQATIKWPNDVLLDGRKVCGILIEQRGVTVAGIGVNVNQSAEMFDAARLPEATSLAAAAGRPFDCEEVTRLLIRRLDTEYRLLLDGEVGLLEACWRERLGLLDRTVTAECHDGDVCGRLLELSFTGVVLESPGGTMRQLAPETIRQLRPSPQR
jgi:BirA family transcriptional regulator, biotin operon repressor / biotin---[acetyl-CoA-carboxylase] ligase